MSTIRRGFTDIAEGQVHFRIIQGGGNPHNPPLVLLHSSPLSSVLLVKLAVAMAPARDVIAIDTLGQGDSCPPAHPGVMMDYFAHATIRTLDTLGEDFSQVDVFGTHTGARIAAEMAINHPSRVRKVILDGIRRMPGVIYDSYVEAVDMSRHIDSDGTQFFKAWNKWRDEYLFKPPHRWVLEQMTGSPLPSPRDLHDAAVEVFKGILHGHVAYRAAIYYRVDERLPLIGQPTLVTCGSNDGSFVDLEYAASLIPGAEGRPHPVGDRVEHLTEDGLLRFAAMLSDWLDQAPNKRP
jgi:pimeloyl-ACP methyl ester carboxylesterase